MKNMRIVFAEYFQKKNLIWILFLIHMPQRHQYLKGMALKDKNYNTIAHRSGLEANHRLLGSSSQRLLNKN